MRQMGKKPAVMMSGAAILILKPALKYDGISGEKCFKSDVKRFFILHPNFAIFLKIKKKGVGLCTFI